MSELAGKRVVVVGLGASGVAAARLCLRRGARVVANDGKPRDALSRGRARARGAGRDARRRRARRGADATRRTSSSSRRGCRRSPEIDAAERARACRCWGEVELAVRSMTHPAPVVAIGGTNGKSTTTSLVGALLEAARPAHVRRRQPRRAARRPRRTSASTSSSSRCRASRWSASTASGRTSRALLNVTDDHLDRYPSFDDYARAKGNAFVRPDAPTTGRSCPPATPLCAREARRGARPPRHVRAGRRRRRHRRTRSSTGAPASASRGADMALTGGHNALNVAAAIACVAPVRRRRRRPSAACSRTFRGLPHRTALVAEIGGVRFYDDSKGTNVGAAVTALEGLVEPRGGAHRRRARQGRELRAARRAPSRARAAPRSSSARRRTRSRRAIGDSVPVRRAAHDGRGRAHRARRSPRRATPCSSRRPARASTCSATTSTAATSSSAPCARSRRIAERTARDDRQPAQRPADRRAAARGPARRQAERRGRVRARSTPCSRRPSWPSSGSAS